MMQTCTYQPIGIIRSPFEDIQGMPIQPAGAAGVRGRIEMDRSYAAGLSDLDGFSHIILLYHFHKAGQCQLKITPFLDTHPRGLFATRAPNRPNPIGISIVKLIHVQGNVLTIEDVDVLDETPLLDIKPYVPRFDSHAEARAGWLDKSAKHVGTAESDERFR